MKHINISCLWYDHNSNLLFSCELLKLATGKGQMGSWCSFKMNVVVLKPSINSELYNEIFLKLFTNEFIGIFKLYLHCQCFATVLLILDKLWCIFWGSFCCFPNIFKDIYKTNKDKLACQLSPNFSIFMRQIIISIIFSMRSCMKYSLFVATIYD